MYHDLRDIYWWNKMKSEVAMFVSRCPNCQPVKAKNQGPSGLTYDIDIPTWKCEHVNMDFVVGLPRTHRQHHSIWVKVDSLTKSAHFLLVMVNYSAEEYVKLYVREIV